MHTPRFVIIAPVFALIGLAAVAQAAPTYSLQFESSSIAVAPNGSVDVDLYLVETLGIGDESIFANDNGLQLAQFDVSQVSGSAIITDATANPQFDDPGSVFSFSSFYLEGTLFALGESPPVLPDVNGRILLATIEFTVGDFDSGSSLYSAEAIDVFSTFSIIAPFIEPTGGTLELTVLPEPASMLLVGAGLVLLVRRRR